MNNHSNWAFTVIMETITKQNCSPVEAY